MSLAFYSDSLFIGGPSNANYVKGYDNFLHNGILFDSSEIENFRFSGTKTEDMLP